MVERTLPARIVVLAILFECGLGGSAVVIGWLCGHSPAIGINADSSSTSEQILAASLGLLATVPLLMGLLLIERLPLDQLQRLREKARSLILEMFAGASVVQLAAVALAAGFGEELLFRGLLQAGVARLIGGPHASLIGLGLASIVFGVCHWLDRTYAFLATLAGAYFGWLLLATGSLWTPIIAHAVYDFLALAYLVRPNRLLRSSV